MTDRENDTPAVSGHAAKRWNERTSPESVVVRKTLRVFRDDETPEASRTTPETAWCEGIDIGAITALYWRRPGGRFHPPTGTILLRSKDYAIVTVLTLAEESNRCARQSLCVLVASEEQGVRT